MLPVTLRFFSKAVQAALCLSMAAKIGSGLALSEPLPNRKATLPWPPHARSGSPLAFLAASHGRLLR
jgi:hypothetical protein